MSEHAPPTGGLVALRERKRVLDAAWLVLMAVILIAVLVPWFVRVLEVDAGAVAWAVFAYAALYMAATGAVDRLRDARSLSRSLLALQALNVVFLGILWLMIGGAQLSVFLLVFVLPVAVSGIVMRRWEPYAITAISIVVTGWAALATSPALRWYADRLGLPWLRAAGELLADLPLLAEPFLGTDPHPSQLAATLIVFAVLLMTTAVAISAVGGVVQRLERRLTLSRKARSEAEGLAERVLRASRDPAALVHVGSRQVTLASDAFLRRLLVRPEELPDRTLFDIVEFTFPDVVEGVLRGGEVVAAYRVGPETRVARVTASPIVHRGTEYAYLVLHDVTELSHLRRALDALDEMYILVGTDGRVVYFNEGTLRKFERLYLSAPADQGLVREDLPDGWWNPGPRARVRLRLSLDDVLHDVSVVTTEMPGEPGRIALLTLRAGGPEAA